MRQLLLLAVALVGVLVALVSGRLVRRYVVDGRSMLRAYEPGDRLLVENLTYRFKQPRVGDVVVVRWPHALSRPAGSPELDLKRIAAGPGSAVQIAGREEFLGSDEWYVLGDNMDESRDSRELGPVRTHNLQGRVWRKY